MKRTFLIKGMMLAAVLAAASIVGWLKYRQWRETAWREQCRRNIAEIHEPMYCCIPMEKNLSLGAPIDIRDVLPYIKGGKLPKCPSGAEYRIQCTVGAAPPTCPYHGVLVTKKEWDRQGEEEAQATGGGNSSASANAGLATPQP